MEYVREINEVEMMFLEHSLINWQLSEPSLHHIRVDFRKRLSEIFYKSDLTNIFIWGDSSTQCFTGSTFNSSSDVDLMSYKNYVVSSGITNMFTNSMFSDDILKSSTFACSARMIKLSSKTNNNRSASDTFEKLCTFCKNSCEPA